MVVIQSFEGNFEVVVSFSSHSEKNIIECSV